MYLICISLSLLLEPTKDLVTLPEEGEEEGNIRPQGQDLYRREDGGRRKEAVITE